MRHFVLASVTSLALFVVAAAANAQTVTPASGWLYSYQSISGLTQSCVQSAAGGTFVGSGPGFTGNAQSVLFVAESGGERVVVSGLNSIGDCVYDAATDTLFVTDNGMETDGSVTGDTVFAIPAASTASGLTALGRELVAAGSIPSASGLAMDAAGDLYVADSVGTGAGNVRKISGGVMSSFATGFEFAGGLAVDAGGDVYVAESLASFENQISRYNSAGAFQGLVSGPTFGHGSYDLVFDDDGTLVVTGLFGGDVVKIDPTDTSSAVFASGFMFATGAERNAFTGRVQLLSSTFVPEDEDSRIHKLVPVDRLVAGRGNDRTECFSELYGLELVARQPEVEAKKARCMDGQACDADGTVNDVCVFPVGFCLNVDDSRSPQCAPTEITSFVLKKNKPFSASLQIAVASVAAALPLSESSCFFSDGISVPVGMKLDGTPKIGKGVVKVRADRDGPRPHKDTDAVKLRCLPAAP
jgi:hypothetical protein